jgi:hypothetical protein
MRYTIFFLVCFFGQLHAVNAQYIQTIHTPGIPNSKPVLAIDSIRFNLQMNAMEIVEINGRLVHGLCAYITAAKKSISNY